MFKSCVLPAHSLRTTAGFIQGLSTAFLAQIFVSVKQSFIQGLSLFSTQSFTEEVFPHRLCYFITYTPFPQPLLLNKLFIKQITNKIKDS